MTLSHQFINNTPAQNKGLRIRRQRSGRVHDKTVTTIPDLLANQWPENPRETVMYERLDVRPGEGNQWAWNVHKGPEPLSRRYNVVHWDQVAVTGSEPMLKWGTREYNVENRLVTRCDFTDIAQEHGMYISNSGSTRVDESTFLRCGSQGLQFAHRPNPYGQYSGDCMPYQRPPRHEVNDCDFIDNGFKGTRPSFTLTYFDPGSTEWPGIVRVRRSSFVADWSEDGPKGNRSTGAFVLTPAQGGPTIDPTQGDMLSYTEIRDCLCDYTKGDRPVGIVRGSSTLAIIGSCFITRDHPQPFIDVDSGGEETLQGMKTKRILIRNCRAKDCRLRVWGPDKNLLVEVDLDTPAEEVWINGITGQVTRIALR